MSTVEFEPVELISVELEPVFAILRDEDPNIIPNSKLFPDNYPEDLTGPLGDYAQGNPPNGSTADNIIGGLDARAAEIRAEISANRGQLTEITYSGLCATALQIHLTKCIDRSCRNLMDDLDSPIDAITVLSSILDAQEARQIARFNSDIENMTALRAKYGESIKPEAKSGEDVPDIDAEARADQASTPALLVAVQQECLDYEIDKVYKDLKRLKFEWMSAMAIMAIMRKGEVPMSVASRFPNHVIGD
jgi:hypothetical protein